jgi:membrane protein
MDGKQHLITGAAIATFNVAMYKQITANWTNSAAVDFVTTVKDFIIPQNIIIGIFAVLLYILGLLAPDCDKPYSTLGKYFYVPIEHRTWLHTAYIIIMFAILGIFIRPFIAFAIGYFIHLFFDSFSACGICWFNPFGYKHYPNGGKVKKGHFIILYFNDITAYIVCFVVWLLVICYVLGVMNLVPIFTVFVDTFDSSFESFISLFVH